MIGLEVRRANLRKGICSQHFQNTFILKKIRQKNTPEQIMKHVGFKTNIFLKGYLNYYGDTQSIKHTLKDST